MRCRDVASDFIQIVHSTRHVSSLHFIWYVSTSYLMRRRRNDWVVTSLWIVLAE